MQTYQRVIFISTINDANPLAKRDILSRFNEDATTYFQRGEITGLLFYGNDHFLHYLESDSRRMEQLKADVMAYPYHHSQKLIYEEKGPQKQFISWQMKYTQNDSLVQAFFARHGWQRFNPYLLEGELLDEFRAIIMSYADAGDLIIERPLSVPEKPPLFWHYVLGTLALLCIVWLASLVLNHFGYMELPSFYQ